MARFFNIAGPCDPEYHYMLPPERRLPGVRELIDQRLYFVVHAPRQVGKTTACRALAEDLTAKGRYVALHTSCETGQAAGRDVERGVMAVIQGIELDARKRLPASRQPPDPDAGVTPERRLEELLSRWSSELAPVPLVLFLDEIDALLDETLIAVLRQLRSGYPSRPQGFPQAVALIGLRDVRDYQVHVRPDRNSLGTSSPFNIKVESITIRDFTAAEVVELYEQHTADTGQVFTAEAKSLAFELTRGQPWLVNALARQVVEKDVRDRALAITAAHIDAAREALILRRDTHLDSLIERLHEPRVQRIIEPILAGQMLPPDTLSDDIAFAMDLGLVTSGPSGLEIANPIYREVIPRALSWVLQETLPIPRAPYIAAGGALRFGKVLEDFVAFWREHAEFLLGRHPYSEAAPQLVLLAYLQRIVNAGGTIAREYAAGSGRMDLLVRWRGPAGEERHALELKVWRDRQADPLGRGIEQLGGYLERLGLATGTLVIFDRRAQAPPLAERCGIQEVEHGERVVRVVRL
ncbi:MAG: ATP-binding protein [Candidatus Schekmanbacteria bacterium]|nr:ATP-binding protein [Candidatus Schekmanbacteria bacterium]